MPDEDRESHPQTEAFVPDFSDDTGSQPVPVVAEPEAPEPETPAPDTAPEEDTERDGVSEAGGAPVQPVAVPGRYHYLKWWQLVLVLLGVWAVGAVVGLGLFYWWYHTIDKAPAVFAVLVYVVACVVGGVMLAMHSRPLISALSIAVMSGPLAAVAAAAPLYGYYYCERVGHCLIGVIPY
ncbi:hypothetical protein A5747_18260 [Mycobacterium sp. IS-836]|nr:hypothetical protein [Mycobacterium sp. IS-836]OMC53827.1 hypothetical protein A5747_18260 [Mycobacterium sp. IS-836]